MSGEKQKMILLVEDEAIIAMAEKLTLEKYGYRVLVAHDGEQAVASVKKTPGIDLILMDINLGTGMDGTEAAAIILKDRDLPVVFLSSHMEPEVVAKTEKITSYGYVVKDSSGTVLDASIKMAFKLFEAKISEKGKEAALQESEEIMRYIVKHDPNAVAVYDRDLHYIAASDRYLQDYNVREADIIGKHHYKVFPEMPQRWKDVHQRCLAGAIERNDDDFFERPDGSITYNRWECRPWRRVTGEIGGIITYTEVTTERKLAEIKLAQSHDLLTKLARLVPGVIYQYRLDPDGRSAFPYASPGMNDIYELTPEEVREDATPVFALLHPDDYDMVAGAIQASAQTLNTFFCEFRVILPRQGLRWHWSQAHPERLADGGTLWHGIISDITEQKLAEEALRASQQLIEGIINTISVRVFWKDLNLVYLGCNSAFARDAGFTNSKDIIGKDDYQMTWRDQADLYRRDDLQVIESGHAKLLIEEPQTTPEGLTINLMTSKMPLRNAKGEIVGVLGTYMDITERKQAEQALHENEKRLKDIMFSMADWVWEVDQNGVYTYSSEKGLDFLGASRGDILGKTPFDFMSPKEAKRVGAIFSEIIANKKVIRDLENWNIGRDGEMICLLTNGVPILDEKGNLKGYRGVDKDITERKRAEEAIKNTLLFQQVLMDAVPSPIFYKDVNLVYIGGNKAFERYVGLSREQFIGKTVYDIWPADLAAKYDKADSELLKKTGMQTYEASVVYADGTRREVVFHKAPFKDAEGHVAGLIGVILDISERKQAEEEIKRQLAEKEILLKEVHHRIKNNLASVSGLLSMQAQALANPQAAAVLQDAIGRVESMRILYDKLLLSEGFQDLPVKNYVESLAAAVISLFPEKAKVKLEQNVDEFNLDPKRLFPLGIIINELLTNIMKYAFSGKKSGQIRLSLAKADHQVTLTLQDNGVGLPDGFDLEGSKGFGLILVKMLSQQLGGSFTIEKRKGTQCKIEFNI